MQQQKRREEMLAGGQNAVSGAKRRHQHAPYVEYTRQADPTDEGGEKRAVARKSTGAGARAVQKPTGPPPITWDRKGERMKAQIKTVEAMKFVSHQCGPCCLGEDDKYQVRTIICYSLNHSSLHTQLKAGLS